MSTWQDGEINFLVNNWKTLSTKNRVKWAKSIGRSYQACEKMYYKSRNKDVAPVKTEQKPAVITVSHTTKTTTEQKVAIIKIGEVVLELPNGSNYVSINGNTLSW